MTLCVKCTITSYAALLLDVLASGDSNAKRELVEYACVAPRDGTEISTNMPKFQRFRNSLCAIPKTPLPKDGCCRTLSDDGSCSTAWLFVA
jgi:hypothetical protein